MEEVVCMSDLIITFGLGLMIFKKYLRSWRNPLGSFKNPITAA